MCLFLKNVLILELSVYLSLFFTNFVLVLHKISRKRAYYKVFTLCPNKRGRFLIIDQPKTFFLEITTFKGQKSGNPRYIQSENFFRDHYLFRDENCKI